MSGTDFALIGPGRLGLQLASALESAGHRCVAVRSRKPRTRHERSFLPHAIWDTWERQIAWPVFSFAMICVSDANIREAAIRIADSLPLRNRCIFHTSGFATADELEACREHGAYTASWHPLQSFTDDPRGASERFRGVWCAIEGMPGAVARGDEIAIALGMSPWHIAPEQKALYHAAAALAANLTHVLVAEAHALLVSCGMSPPAARRALEELATSSVVEAARGEGFRHLTGPMARGDKAIVEGHLKHLPAPFADVYRTLWAWVRRHPTPIDRR